MDMGQAIELGSKLGAVAVLAGACWANWKELRGVRKAIHAGNNATQEILVKALTGELKSYAQWNSERDHDRGEE